MGECVGGKYGSDGGLDMLTDDPQKPETVTWQESVRNSQFFFHLCTRKFSGPPWQTFPQTVSLFAHQVGAGHTHCHLRVVAFPTTGGKNTHKVMIQPTLYL